MKFLKYRLLNPVTFEEYWEYVKVNHVYPEDQGYEIIVTDDEPSA